MEKVHHKGEQLLLSQLSLFQDLVQGSKVSLNLLLDVIVHASLDLVNLDTLHVHMYLSYVDMFTVVVLLSVLLRYRLGKINTQLHNLFNSVLQPLVLKLELLEVLLLCSDVKLVLLVQDTSLSQDTGHVANLVLHLLLLVLQLLNQFVSNVKSCRQSGGTVLSSLSLVSLSLVATQKGSHSLSVAGGVIGLRCLKHGTLQRYFAEFVSCPSFL